MTCDTKKSRSKVLLRDFSLKQFYIRFYSLMNFIACCCPSADLSFTR